MLWVKAAYTLNVILLAPVLVSMYTDSDSSSIRAFQGCVKNSEGLRLMLAALWSSILLLSCAGLFLPKLFLPILILQVIYKSFFLLTYCFPRIRARKINELPIGLSISFLLIVMTYPFIIYCGLTAN